MLQYLRMQYIKQFCTELDEYPKDSGREMSCLYQLVPEGKIEWPWVEPWSSKSSHSMHATQHWER